MGSSHLSGPLYVGGAPVSTGAFEPQGDVYYVDPVYGSDGNSGEADAPKKTLEHTYALLRDGYGDGIRLYSYYGISTTAYLDAAVDWAKNNTFLEGICAPTGVSMRARIGNTDVTSAPATMLTVSATNVRFQNLHIIHESDDDEDQCALSVTGGRSAFLNCHIAGMVHATPAARAGSCSLKLSGAYETLFRGCHIGLTTISRTAANAELVVVTATKAARNEFDDCTFLSACSGSGTGHGFVSLAANSLQDYILFKNCRGINAIWASSGVAMAYGFLKTVGDVNGLVFLENCKWNSTNLAADLTDVVADGRYDGTDLTTDLGIMVTPTNT